MIDYTQGSGKQYHIGVGPEDVGQYVILPGDPGRCEKIAKYFDDAKQVGQNREYVTYTGYLNGVKISVTSTGIGGPSASIALEELSKCGAHTFIRIGTCGGMQPEVLAGDVVIASGSIRQEGTSREYAPIEYPAVCNYETINALVAASKALNQTYHVGITQSKDAFYGQHEPEKLPNSQELIRKWDAWLKMGCLCSEMETAALCIVGAYLKARIGGCYLVCANQTRAAMGLDNPQCHDIDRAIKVAVEAMRIIIEDDKKKNK